ncbi:MAG: UbiA family prenyltransferase [Candidatus Kariarchaeaceae archaeon]|jgi:geranylgeranylglycerol-phosphate geranylgeranyltransferase
MSFSNIEKLRGYSRIVRPMDGVVMGVGLILAMVLSGSVELGISFIFYVYVFLAGFFVTSHAMVVNDIIDIDIDRINEPQRVLPSGLLSQREAALYSIFLVVVGILFFYLIDAGGYDKIPYLWAYGLFHVILADIYNKWLKGTGLIGNIVVAESSYALFLAGDLFLNGRLTLIPQVIGITGFFASLSREIFKGIIDVEGDREHGVRTLAVILGPIKAKYVATVIFALTIPLLVLLFPYVDLIGTIGLIIAISLYLYTLYLTRNAEVRAVSRKIKTYILMGPLIISPFLIVDSLLPL